MPLPNRGQTTLPRFWQAVKGFRAVFSATEHAHCAR
jgi:hypothetical protein